MTPSLHLRTLLIGGLACGNILVFALSGYSLYQSRQQYELRAETLTQNTANALDQNLSSSIEKIDLALRTVADELEHQLAGKGIDDSAVNRFLNRQLERLPEVEAFRVANADGLVILGKGVDKKVGTHWADRDYFIYHRDHADHHLQITKPRMGRVAQQYIIGFSQRYNFPDGRFAGVISAPIAVDYFTKMLAKFDLGAHGTIVLRSADLGLISRVPAILDQAVGQIGNSAVSPDLRRLAESGVLSATFHTPASSDGFQRMGTFHRLAKAPMFVIAGVANDDYLANWKIEVFQTATMAFGFLLLSLLLGGLLLRLLGEAQRREQALADSEEQLRTLVEAVPDSIQFKDGAGRWRIANGVCLKLFGVQGKLWQGLTDTEIGLHQTQQAKALDVCLAGDEAAWAAGKVCRTEECVENGPGNVIHFEVIKVPLFDARNQRRAMVIIGRDISEHKRNEAELEQHRRHLESLVQQRSASLMETEAKALHILQSSADGLYGTDNEGIITFINPAACALLGYRAEQAIGHSAHSLFHHSKLDGTAYPVEECPTHNALHTGQRIRVDSEVYWHADGHALPVMYASHPILQNGEAAGTVVSFVDISVQRAAANAREQALIAAENLARLRSEFLANMSHEIRTPLNGVLGFADIGYRNYQNSEKARDAFGKIKTSGNRLLGVINDILDFSKIEAGKLRIEQTEVCLAEAVDQATQLVRDRALAKHLDLRVELAPDLPYACLSDPLRLGQILLNLLSNAVKFTEVGSVTLSITLQGEQLVFRVVDSGIGMSAEQLGQLFTPFQQGDASATRRFGGTGLGLAISKRILELMSGDIQVESQFGVGSRVEFRLPYIPYIPSAATAVEPLAVNACSTQLTEKPLAGLSILVADDEAVNRMLLEEHLIEGGARVILVGNGREAVERILRDGRTAYDMVLMDIQMPEMDGYEATRRIAELAPDLPIIAQTAHAFSEEREKCLAAGMVGHLAKPIDPNELLRVVLEHVAARQKSDAPLKP
jgi:PAS domain S-box-containing protein